VAIVLHRLKLVHTDLKPENILLVANESFVQGQRVSCKLLRRPCTGSRACAMMGTANAA
jgi:serine/threonine protein kinase